MGVQYLIDACMVVWGAIIRGVQKTKKKHFWDNLMKMITTNMRGGSHLNILVRSEFLCDSKSGVK